MHWDAATLAQMRIGDLVPGVITAVVAFVECMDSDGNLRLVRIADTATPPWKIYGMVEHALHAEPLEER